MNPVCSGVETSLFVLGRRVGQNVLGARAEKNKNEMIRSADEWN